MAFWCYHWLPMSWWQEQNSSNILPQIDQAPCHQRILVCNFNASPLQWSQFSGKFSIKCGYMVSQNGWYGKFPFFELWIYFWWNWIHWISMNIKKKKSFSGICCDAVCVSICDGVDKFTKSWKRSSLEWCLFYSSDQLFDFQLGRLFGSYSSWFNWMGKIQIKIQNLNRSPIN